MSVIEVPTGPPAEACVLRVGDALPVEVIVTCSLGSVQLVSLTALLFCPRCSSRSSCSSRPGWGSGRRRCNSRCRC